MNPVITARRIPAKVITDHQEDNWNGHKSVLLGTKLGLGREFFVRLVPGFDGFDHLSLSRQDSHPDVGGHDGAEHRADVDVSRPAAEHASQAISNPHD